MSEASRLLRVAHKVAEKFSARSREFEIARRLPKDVARELADKGLLGLFAPTTCGGAEISPVDAAAIFEVLAQGDGSMGWVSFICSTSATIISNIPEQAGKEIFNSPNTVVAGVFAPTGKAVKEGDGFRVNGTWKWGSGTENADWILGGCTFYDENGNQMMLRSGIPPNAHGPDAKIRSNIP